METLALLPLHWADKSHTARQQQRQNIARKWFKQRQQGNHLKEMKFKWTVQSVFF